MKYRIIGAVACVCAILLSLAAPLLEGGARGRVHQHLTASVKEDEAQDNGVFSTHLPLVEIDTGGVEIPGKSVRNEDGTHSFTLAADGTDSITAHIDIVDHETTYNHMGDTPTVSSEVEIHVRGNSSRFFDKSNYALRLVKRDGSNNPQQIMGMDSHHEWVLHGPFLDKTLLRNYMWYNIGGEIMDYAPNVRFCELILNGAYQGVYVMLESITAGEKGARLSMTVNAKRSTFSGYLLRLDRGSDSPIKQIDTFSSYTQRTQQHLNIVYPGSSNLTPEIAEGIRQDFSDFEKALYSYDYHSKEYGYATQIDVQSFVDYFLLNELTCNYDAGRFSTYIYKDTSGRFRMCLWDMNSTCDNYQENPIDTQSFQMQNCLWYFMLMKDEDFTEAIIDRYRQLRKTWFSEEYLNRYIDETVAYLGDTVERNYSVWGYTFEPEYDMLTPEERNPRSYEESVAQLKEFLSRRIAWMDANIDTLRQYSADSRIKKFNENAN